MNDVRPGVYILPNLFTSANLFCGFFAIIQALNIWVRGGSNYQSCALAIIAGALFDGMDGRVARRTRSASRFGVEYDSLADLISFGMAPALILYVWTLRGLGRVGWLACFLYMACGALRLARFNVQVGGVEKRFFQGLPIPMAAMMICGTILIWEGKPLGETALFIPGDVQWILLAFTYLLAALMVSEIPYRSFKTLSLTSRHPFYMLVFVVFGLMVWATKPWWVLFLLGCAYLMSGPVEKFIVGPPVEAIRRARSRRRPDRPLGEEGTDLPPSGDEKIRPIRKL